MLRRYELTDQEWNQIAALPPPENSGKRGRPAKDNRPMLNAMVWVARSGAPWRELLERYGPWKSIYSRFRKWMDAYGYPIHLLISEGQRNDINFAIPLLEPIDYRRKPGPCRPGIRQP